MDIFSLIDDAECVTFSRGIYRQTQLYRRGKRIYAKHAGGFIRICLRFGETWPTSVPGVKVIALPEEYHAMAGA